MTPQQRTASAGLVLAASTLVGIAIHESYTDTTVIPVPGDVPTMGFGTTTHADGTPLKPGERTTPPRALVDLLRDASKFEKAVKRCAPVPMYPYEFSSMVSISYNIGEYAFCHSTMVKKLLVYDYKGACEAILLWDKVKGRVVRGLTVRRQDEYKECIGPQAQGVPA
jgi:lysozyme